MIFVSAPLRISFLGGGTDFPGWFETKRGAVLSTTINQYVHVILSELAPIWATKYKFSYSKIENVRTVSEIQHPLIRACIKEFANHNDRLSVLYYSDLPGGSGLGSSSAFCNAMILGLNEYNGGGKIDKRKLAREAIRVERELLMEAGGWQDQVATAYGGFNQISFHSKTFMVKSLNENFSKNYLEDCYLVHVGDLRKAHEVSKDQISNISNKHKLYEEMYNLVDPALATIDALDYNGFSYLIDKSWELKKYYSEGVSNPVVDASVQTLRDLGGTGIKLLGAGSGGFILCRFEDGISEDKVKSAGFEYLIKVSHENAGTRRRKFSRTANNH